MQQGRPGGKSARCLAAGSLVRSEDGRAPIQVPGSVQGHRSACTSGALGSETKSVDLLRRASDGKPNMFGPTSAGAMLPVSIHIRPFTTKGPFRTRIRTNIGPLGWRAERDLLSWVRLVPAHVACSMSAPRMQGAATVGGVLPPPRAWVPVGLPKLAARIWRPQDWSHA